MRLPRFLSALQMSAPQIVGLALVAVGILLLILTYIAQSNIDEIGATNDPDLQDQVSVYEIQRNMYLVGGIGFVFMGMFAIAMLSEPSMPALLSQSGMISTSRMANETVQGLQLKGNACYLPAKHGLTRERIFIPAPIENPAAPLALSDDLVMSPGKDGSTPGMLLEPLGFELLNRIERELDANLLGIGLEAAEGTLQILKHGLGMIKDFHFKEREGKTVLRVEYSGLIDACRKVRKERPDTCRQIGCIGCACLLTAAARATGKVVCIDDVDNSRDTVVFTLTLKEW
ncbi:MAG: hypothetical protein KJ563_07280 [Candidatus Thermoplasmatota archaeon]|nr:hypothetical protein [Candidatus Thermoplasmatota archaeon]